MKKLLLILTMLAATIVQYGQVKIGENVETIDMDALLELQSSSKGLVLPRVTLVNLNSPIPTSKHTKGMMVYNNGGTLSEGIYINDGTKWISLGSGSLSASDRKDLSSSDNSIKITNGVGSVLNATTITIDHNVLAELFKNSPYKENIITVVTTSPAFKDSISKVITTDPLIAEKVANNIYNNGKKLSSLSSPIVVTGGDSALLKATNIRLNDTAMAGKLTGKPYTDSLAVAVSKSTALRDSITRTVTSSKMFRDSIASIVTQSPVRDSIIRTVTTSTAFKDSLRVIVSKDTTIVSSTTKNVLTSKEYRDSTTKLMRDSAKNFTSIDAAITLNGGSSVAKSLIADVAINLNDTVLAGKMTSSPYTDSLAVAVSKSTALRDSITRTVTSSKLFRDSIASIVTQSPVKDSIIKTVTTSTVFKDSILKTLANDTTGKVVKFFYMPSIAIDISQPYTNKTIDLYTIYKNQFSAPAVKSTSARSKIAFLPNATDLEYYVPSYDTNALTISSISDSGVLTYSCSGEGSSQYTIVNIIFVIK